MILAFPPRRLGPVLLSAALALLVPASASAQQAQRSGSQQPSRPAQGAAQKPETSSAKPAQARTGPGSTAKPAQPSAGTGKPAPASAPGGSGATLIASFGEWGVYTAQTGRTKICYALTQPKDRQPKNVNRDPAYLFVSFRPAENVRNEVALVMGFSAREDGSAEATIGSAKYALLTKDQHAWLKNPSEEGQAISTMAKGQNILVKAQSSRGTQLTDRYSLSGFGQALERARKECS